MTIVVSLNTSANPPVTVNPKNEEIGSGSQTITWVRAPQQTFSFTSLSGLPSPPFSSPSISASEITVTDNNQNNGPAVYYAYTIVVTLNSQEYSTAASGITAQSTGPTIKNR